MAVIVGSAEAGDRLRSVFSRKMSLAKNKGISFQFEGPDESIAWWNNALLQQRNSCAYRETRIRIIRELINRRLIAGRNGKIPDARGPNFEIDQKDGKGAYSADNCVLACLCCNNDKSNIYDHVTYKEVFGPARSRHFRYLAEQAGLSWD
ncbi:hypothetical protein [Bradyrhizobium sp. YR681]|uniref:hypothetical protein n=1 Tax=Bradyrhizobium sp. YR681 TaxID=1144344 RepID=UPI0012F64603|nr:hypothetical protein [Bradyrhizobium sp. YR681]